MRVGLSSFLSVLGEFSLAIYCRLLYSSCLVSIPKFLQALWVVGESSTCILEVLTADNYVLFADGISYFLVNEDEYVWFSLK